MTSQGFNYPPEYVDPDIKETDEYGLAYAKAMYYANNRYGARFFYDDSEYTSLMEVAQGRQSVDNIRRMFGHFTSQNGGAADDGSGSLAYIDVQVLNLAPKYINRAVAKMQRLKYDIGLAAVDPVSVDETLAYDSQLKALYRLDKWFKDMGQDPRAMFPDLDVEELPKYQDEMMLDATANPKIKKVIAGELSLTLLNSINSLEEKMRMTDWDEVVFGHAHMHCYMDENGVPRNERINAKYWLGSYVDDENYDRQENAGFFDFITVNQFIKETKGKMPAEQVEAIIQRFAFTNGPQSNNTITRDWSKYDGLDYIPVMRFYYLSQDDRRFIIKKNKIGSKILMERAYDWKPSEETAHRYGPKGDSKISDTSYTSVYGGCWIIDSDIVYNYGRQDLPRTNLVNARLPIVTVAPNMKEGRIVSFAAQMVEPLYMINVCWNKIKQILARGWMGIREINFNEIENIAIGKGGQQWKAYDVYMHLLQTDTLIRRGAVTQWDQTRASSAVSINTSGLTLQDYVVILSTAINTLEQMTGTSLVEAAEKTDRLAVGVMKESQFASDLDMEYLYHAHEKMYKKVSHMNLLLMQQAKRNKVKIRDFIPALGKMNLQYYEVPDEIAYCDYGLMLVPQPSEQEWADFYTDVSIALKDGRIGVSDSAYLRSITNLKQAREVMVIRETQHKRQVQQEAKMANDMMMESNAQSAELKMQSEIAKVREKGRVDAENLVLNGKIQENLQKQKFQFDMQVNSVKLQVDREIAKQVSVDEITKQAVRNIPEKQKVLQKSESDILKANTDAQKIEVDKIKAQAAAKKPKAA